MVSKAEEAELNRLETQVDNGGGGAWDYLCLIRKLKVRRSHKVLNYGLSILNDSRKRSGLGQEEWTLYEQVAIAALDCQAIDVAKDCIKVLQKKFPQSKRVGRLEAMLLEAKGLWAEAEKAYASLLEENPCDQIVHKRRVALAKAQGNIAGAIEWLNKYLETFMADHDAWRELAELYISLQMYKQAVFCYEELILSQPTVPLFHLAYADVLYTLGGLENLQTAKKYYASTIDLTGGKNTRALFGICLCTSAIAQLTRGRNKEDKDTYENSSTSKKSAGGVANEKKQTYIFKEPAGESVVGDKKTYNAQKIVGNGTFGVVFKAQIAETGETVAIKKVFQDKRYKNRELQILKELSHPHVTNLRHAFYTQGDSNDEVYLNIVMDYIPGNLYEIIKYYRQSKHKVPNVLIKLYSYQIFRSLAYIHGIGICHRDIKPQNLLVNPSTHLLKLCDFGSAKRLIANEPNVSYICSRYYRAPELIFGATFYDCAIDVWSSGCVIAEMILGEPLFLGESALDQLVEIIKILGTPTQSQILQMNPNSEEFRLPQIKAQAWSKVLKNADPLVIDLIAKVLAYNPKDRLKPMEALAHPYFNDLRNQNFQIQECKIPELFNFSAEELGGVKQETLDVIIPSWKKSK